MGILRPVYPSPDPITTVDGTSTAVAVGAAKAFWIHVGGAARVAVRTSSTPLTLNSGNSAALAANQLYGPFPLMTGHDTHIHVAGVGGTPVATITLV